MKYLNVLVVFLLIGIDQLTKRWAVTNLMGQADIKLIPDVFHLAYVENRGAAFGIFEGKQTFFIIMTTLTIVGILFYWRQIPNDKLGKWMRVAFLLVIAGGIGNLIDRVMLGYVVDLFYFILIDFPVFNVADICVVVGVILLFPLLLLSDMEESKKNKAELEGAEE